MTLRLYLDDCANDTRLVEILRAPPYSHHVVIPIEVGIASADDDIHLDYARRHDLILITKNPRDFVLLHEANHEHPGIFLIYQDNRPGDMTPVDIARAIQNLEAARVPLRDTVHELNHWRYG